MIAESEKVSCRNLPWLLDAFAERGLTSDQLLVGARVSAEHMTDPSRFIDWYDLVSICENFGKYIPESEIVECGMQSVEHPIFRVLRTPAKLIYEVEDLYWHLVRPHRGHIPRSYPTLYRTILERTRASLHFAIEVREPFEPIREWQLMLLGQCIALPRVLGLPDARVEMSEYPRGAHFEVSWSGSGRALLAPLRRLLTYPFTARATARQLIEINMLLEDKYRRLQSEMDRREATEATLSQSEARHRLLATHVRDVIFATDLDLKYTYLSLSAEDFFGRPLAEILEVGPGDGITPDSFDLVKTSLREELEKEGNAEPSRSRTLELEMVRKDGSIRFIELNVGLLRDEAGRPEGIMGVTRDVSERRRTAEQLRQAQKMESIGHLAGGSPMISTICWS